MTILANGLVNLCDCSLNEVAPHCPCRKYACGSPEDHTVCGVNCKNNTLQQTEKRIQNQVMVHESQYIDVLGAITIAGGDQGYLHSTPTIPPRGSMIWGNKFNLRNQSDRRVPSNSLKKMNLINIVPRRGTSSVRSTITANKPGAMTPGGQGVDVKHGSYARYLGKLKGQTMALGSQDQITHQPTYITPCGLKPRSNRSRLICSSSMNNKSYRFTLVNTSNCKCNEVN